MRNCLTKESLHWGRANDGIIDYRTPGRLLRDSVPGIPKAKRKFRCIQPGASPSTSQPGHRFHSLLPSRSEGAEHAFFRTFPFYAGRRTCSYTISKRKRRLMVISRRLLIFPAPRSTVHGFFRRSHA
ncbi:hypothetical protein AVEN_121643-1 [Araneus ventricosus]|uniref:Uncharacterized protein n=1 Tax=Araneus ventricosus TaxID=182803 RepID=A0A4Y2KU62_ARAVE|nr:hypothetical protein AVEN_121643-1 [Araneus ventricosus]